jgi:hypothetical protein
MPQAILLQDVETLGPRGTVVDVSKGYLRNYLIPRKLAERLHVLEQDCLGHRRLLAIAVAAAIIVAGTSAIIAAGLCDVREQRQLARALDRAADLVLVPPAGAGDAP